MIHKIMLASQIIVCLAGVYAILSTKHSAHSYFAGLVAWLWAGSMLSVAIGGIVAWPQALSGITLLKTVGCGALSGLAIYSGGNIFKVWRLVQSIP